MVEVIRRVTPMAAWALLLVVAGCDSSSDGAALGDAEVVANAANPLSAWVRWTTASPASSQVVFGEGETFAFAVSDETPVVQHELLVVGLRPGRSYTLEARSSGHDGTEQRSPALEFTAGELPIADVTWSLSVHEPDRMQPGWTLCNVATRGGDAPLLAVALDDEGVPVWAHARPDGHGGRGDVDVSWVDGDRVLIGGGVAPGRPVEVDLAGRVVWEGPPQTDDSFLAPDQMHHGFQKLAGGDYLTLVWAEADEVYDAVVQLDADGESVWRWDAADHLRADELDDYIWGNYALADADEDAVYYHGVANGTLYKIDRSDGAVRWRLGADGDFANPAEGAHPHPWFWGAHNPEWTADGHLLLYDNGKDGRGFARALELAVDEGARVATPVWEYPADPDDDLFHNPQWGDADRLANGNTLITAGSTFGDSSSPRLFEVTADGDKVWEVWFDSLDAERSFGAYAADRIPAPVERL